MKQLTIDELLKYLRKKELKKRTAQIENKNRKLGKRNLSGNFTPCDIRLHANSNGG